MNNSLPRHTENGNCLLIRFNLFFIISYLVQFIIFQFVICNINLSSIMLICYFTPAYYIYHFDSYLIIASDHYFFQFLCRFIGRLDAIAVDRSLPGTHSPENYTPASSAKPPSRQEQESHSPVFSSSSPKKVLCFQQL